MVIWTTFGVVPLRDASEGCFRAHVSLKCRCEAVKIGFWSVSVSGSRDHSSDSLSNSNEEIVGLPVGRQFDHKGPIVADDSSRQIDDVEADGLEWRRSSFRPQTWKEQPRRGMTYQPRAKAWVLELFQDSPVRAPHRKAPGFWGRVRRTVLVGLIDDSCHAPSWHDFFWAHDPGLRPGLVCSAPPGLHFVTMTEWPRPAWALVGRNDDRGRYLDNDMAPKGLHIPAQGNALGKQPTRPALTGRDIQGLVSPRGSARCSPPRIDAEVQ